MEWLHQKPVISSYTDFKRAYIYIYIKINKYIILTKNIRGLLFRSSTVCTYGSQRELQLYLWLPVKCSCQIYSYVKKIDPSVLIAYIEQALVQSSLQILTVSLAYSLLTDKHKEVEVCVRQSWHIDSLGSCAYKLKV